MQTKRVNWALDADINGFFDTVDHAWLMQFLEHRSRRQRAVIPPLLANINLHYVFDLWAQQWRGRHANADVIDRCAAMAGARVIGVQPRRHRVHAGEDLEDHRRPRADRVDPEAARRRSTVERIASRAARSATTCSRSRPRRRAWRRLASATPTGAPRQPGAAHVNAQASRISTFMTCARRH